MSRVKIKKKKIGAEDMKAIEEFSRKAFGQEDADADIIRPKIKSVISSVSKIARILDIFLDLKVLDCDENYKTNEEDIIKFRNNISENIKVNNIKIYDEKKYIDECVLTKSLHEMDKKSLNSLYKNLKKEESVKEIIITASYIKRYSKYIEDSKNLDGGFINNEVGHELFLLSFTKLNFKDLWINENFVSIPNGKSRILTLLSHLYKYGTNIYNLITSPDVDVKEFSYYLIKAIDRMKREMPQCSRAFKVITDSMGLLEKNFDVYFRDSVVSKNPSVIMESYIFDLCSKQKHDFRVVRELKIILNYIKEEHRKNKKNKKLNNKGISDDNIDYLFGLMDNCFGNVESENKTKQNKSK